MISKDEMRIYLKNNLIENRYIHTLGVVDTAIRLAKMNKVDEEKAEIAALAHDIAKNMTIYELKEILDKNNIELSYDEEKNQELWHSMVGPIVAKEVFKIEDEEILSAMRWHTTGKENMSKLDKVIYMADMIEPNRNFPGVDALRRESFKDLDNGVLLGLNHTIKYLLNKGVPIDVNSIKARNYLLLHK
ncbi:bis(5'-nucleosyl)-tetraphosphatase (symmetrical) YqeK [Clostridium sp. AL.422]|uniref:bis(5'-nucleosyl)-tetraphosphatase (symmetrical) YqeK n=1 Tax=Clostridium TaxID=1485 RepID=UPI00293DDDCE|nr:MULTISPECIES: bis(5'-nucleosyl)-tetraphosphatase (symmetrical) YqeK [unclassified Clostridium]MDV4149964.1 bis(5'-nucleosyl)-tetraphosphatase (symmetrical) YqeK [Clostridium sp. AL.422]